jgi:hypothetical protein
MDVPEDSFCDRTGRPYYLMRELTIAGGNGHDVGLLDLP